MMWCSQKAPVHKPTTIPSLATIAPGRAFLLKAPRLTLLRCGPFKCKQARSTNTSSTPCCRDCGSWHNHGRMQVNMARRCGLPALGIAFWCHTATLDEALEHIERGRMVGQGGCAYDPRVDVYDFRFEMSKRSPSNKFAFHNFSSSMVCKPHCPCAAGAAHMALHITIDLQANDFTPGVVSCPGFRKHHTDSESFPQCNGSTCMPKTRQAPGNRFRVEGATGTCSACKVLRAAPTTPLPIRESIAQHQPRVLGLPMTLSV